MVRGCEVMRRRLKTGRARVIGPKDGKGAGLVLPFCDTQAMNLRLIEIALKVTPANTLCS